MTCWSVQPHVPPPLPPSPPNSPLAHLTWLLFKGENSVWVIWGNVFKFGLHVDSYEQISFKLSVMIDMTKVYILIPLLIALIFIQEHRDTRKLELVPSSCCKVAGSSSNLCSSLSCKGDDNTEILWVWQIWIIRAFRGFPTRMVYLYYISCWRCTIPVGNPQFALLVKCVAVNSTIIILWWKLTLLAPFYETKWYEKHKWHCKGTEKVAVLLSILTKLKKLLFFLFLFFVCNHQLMNDLYSSALETDLHVFCICNVQVLNASRYNLTNCLIPDRHMDFLRSKHILSQDDCEEITSPDTERKRASKFLDILMKKGAEAYDALCAALKEEGTQTFLLRQLNEDFERRYRNYRGRDLLWFCCCCCWYCYCCCCCCCCCCCH